MARSMDPETKYLYDLHRRWIGQVLPSGGSLLVSGRAVWTDENLAEVDRHFVETPDLTKDKRYFEKLKDQMVGVSPEGVQLMAELHLVHFLHIWRGAVSAEKKRRDLETILSWMPSPAPLGENIVQCLSPGVAHPGQWVLTRRDTQITWLIGFARAWRRLEAQEQSWLLQDPWAFKDLVQSVEWAHADGARLAMLHLSHPDTFESIVSPHHKRRIVRRFASEPEGSMDVDRQLLAIRERLSAQHGEGFSWYDDWELRLRWSKDERLWKAFLEWLGRFRTLPDFDANEREYKLELGGLLSKARELLLSGDEAWTRALKSALRNRRNNITRSRRFDAGDKLLKWVETDSADAASALRMLWESQDEPHQRLRAFLGALPKEVLATRGHRLSVGSVLLMAQDARRHPPVKVDYLKDAFRLVGWPRDEAELDDAEFYRRALILFQEVVHEGGGLYRDELDAQGALWCLLRVRPAAWPEELWQKLQDYRQRAGAVEVEEEEEDADGDGDGGLDVDPQQSTVDYLEQAAHDLHVERSHLDEIVQLLDDKGQVVLYGPPGTGKTFLALRLARAIAQGDEERVTLVQFHPATSYEDFIEGLRPRVTSAGQVTYEVVPGPLVRAAERARNDPHGRPHVLLIDEINRAHLPKVFGELLFLLEYRSEKAHTIHRPDRHFSLPPNLWLIGTMNTADRSISLIDAAMRRRFHFVPFFPHEGPMEGLLLRWLDRGGGRVGVAALLDRVNQELRSEIGEHLQIGPSHFMGKKRDLSDAALERIWTYNVFPLIEEMFWGNREAIARWRWPEVRSRWASVLEGAVLRDQEPVSERDPS